LRPKASRPSRLPQSAPKRLGRGDEQEELHELVEAEGVGVIKPQEPVANGKAVDAAKLPGHRFIGCQ
jgi:hypothetical protein